MTTMSCCDTVWLQDLQNYVSISELDRNDDFKILHKANINPMAKSPHLDSIILSLNNYIKNHELKKLDKKTIFFSESSIVPTLALVDKTRFYNKVTPINTSMILNQATRTIPNVNVDPTSCNDNNYDNFHHQNDTKFKFDNTTFIQTDLTQIYGCLLQMVNDRKTQAAFGAIYCKYGIQYFMLQYCNQHVVHYSPFLKFQIPESDAVVRGSYGMEWIGYLIAIMNNKSRIKLIGLNNMVNKNELNINDVNGGKDEKEKEDEKEKHKGKGKGKELQAKVDDINDGDRMGIVLPKLKGCDLIHVIGKGISSFVYTFWDSTQNKKFVLKHYCNKIGIHDMLFKKSLMNEIKMYQKLEKKGFKHVLHLQAIVINNNDNKLNGNNDHNELELVSVENVNKYATNIHMTIEGIVIPYAHRVTNINCNINIEKQVSHYFADLCEIILQLHNDAGFGHMDLRWDNIVEYESDNGDTNVKLIDLQTMIKTNKIAIKHDCSCLANMFNIDMQNFMQLGDNVTLPKLLSKIENAVNSKYKLKK